MDEWQRSAVERSERQREIEMRRSSNTIISPACNKSQARCCLICADQVAYLAANRLPPVIRGISTFSALPYAILISRETLSIMRRESPIKQRIALSASRAPTPHTHTSILNGKCQCPFRRWKSHSSGKLGPILYLRGCVFQIGPWFVSTYLPKSTLMVM